MSAQYQNPLFVPNIDYRVDWFRTTLIKKNQAWVKVEFCERVSGMLDPEPYIDEIAGRTNVVTFLTDGFEDVETMGSKVEGGMARAEFEALEREFRPLFDIPEDHELDRREAEEEQQHVPRAPADGIFGDGEQGDLQPEGGGQVQDPPLQLQVPQEGHIIVGEVVPAQIEVNGQALTPGSSLSALRAACGFYKVSKSGRKGKCYRRLCQH